MKKIFILLLALCLAAPMVSAEVMNIAMPMGEGRWAWMFGRYQDTNISSNTGSGTNGKYIDMYVYKIARGLSDKMDIIWQYASTSNRDNGTIFSGLGLAFKYSLLSESAELLQAYPSKEDRNNKNPAAFSAALILGYNSISASLIGSGNTNGSQVYGGIEMSKIISAVAPYIAVIGKTSSYDNALSFNQLDLTIGMITGIWPGAGFFSEYTSQTISSSGGAAYSIGQLALGIGLVF